MVTIQDIPKLQFQGSSEMPKLQFVQISNESPGLKPKKPIPEKKKQENLLLNKVFDIMYSGYYPKKKK